MTSRFAFCALAAAALLSGCGDDGETSARPDADDGAPVNNGDPAGSGGTANGPNPANVVAAGQYSFVKGNVTIQLAFRAGADGMVTFREGEYFQTSGNVSTLCGFIDGISTIRTTATADNATQVDVDLRSAQLINNCNFSKVRVVFDGSQLTAQGTGTGSVAFDQDAPVDFPLQFEAPDGPWAPSVPGYLAACRHECELVAAGPVRCEARSHTKPLFRCRERCTSEQAAFASPACEAATLERTRCALRQPDRCAFRVTTDACSAEQLAVQNAC